MAFIRYKSRSTSLSADKAEHDISQLVDNADRSCTTPYLATRLKTPVHFGTPRATPRASPFHSPRSTPSRSLRSTPARGMTPHSTYGGDDDDERTLRKPRSHIYPKVLSGLTDVNTFPGESAELKCYLLTVPGLTTRWEKDGVALEETARVRTYETRGVRGLSISGLKESDTGVYSVRILGDNTDMYTSAKISVLGKCTP